MPSPLPDAMRDIVRIAPSRLGSSGAGTAPEPLPISDAELQDLKDALAKIPADDYEVWIKVGMALHNDLHHQIGFDLWDAWSQGSDKYDVSEIPRKWKSFKRRGMGEGVKLETIFWLAQQQESKPALVIVEDCQQAARNAPKSDPKAVDIDCILSLPPVLSEALQWAIATAPVPQPHLLAASILVTAGAVLSRRFQTDQGNHPVLWAVGVMLSGQGKDKVKSCAKELLEAAGMSDRIGGASYTSSNAVISALCRAPAQIAITDEFGLVLQGAQAFGSQNRKDAFTTMMDAWGSCHSSIIGASFSGGAKGSDAPRVVRNPCLSFVAISTPTQFYDALSTESIQSGFLNRFFVIESTLDRQVPKRIQDLSVPESWTAWAATIKERYGLVEYREPDERPPLLAVPFAQGASRLMDAFSVKTTELQNELDARGLAELVGRTREKAMRLALILALAEDPWAEQITEKIAAHAITITESLDMAMVESIHQKVFDSQSAKIRDQVLEVIRKAGASGATRRHLCQYSRKFNACNHREQEDILKALIALGDVVLAERKPKAGKNTPVYLYQETP